MHQCIMLEHHLKESHLMCLVLCQNQNQEISMCCWLLITLPSGPKRIRYWNRRLQQLLKCLVYKGIHLLFRSPIGDSLKSRTELWKQCLSRNVLTCRDQKHTHHSTSPSVQWNGMNWMLEAQLSKFVDEHQQDWDYYVPFLMMALRSAT